MDWGLGHCRRVLLLVGVLPALVNAGLAGCSGDDGSGSSGADGGGSANATATTTTEPAVSGLPEDDSRTLATVVLFPSETDGAQEPAEGPFSLVVFSHGNGGNADRPLRAVPRAAGAAGLHRGAAELPDHQRAGRPAAATGPVHYLRFPNADHPPPDPTLPPFAAATASPP